MGQENMIPTTNVVEKKEGSNFLTSEEMQKIEKLKNLKNSGAIQDLGPKEQIEVWGKVKKLAAVVACFGTAVAGGAYTAYEAILHHGDPTSAGVQMAIGAGIAFIFASLGTVTLEQNK